ncbi:hypothetical protein OFV41_004872 [Escherichia coli]|nr:hypothetical protein [Escherichia coli]
MSDEPGRGKFVDQAAEAKPSVWRRTAGWIREEILHSQRRPARLESAIASGKLIPYPIIAPVDTFGGLLAELDVFFSVIISFPSLDDRLPQIGLPAPARKPFSCCS